MIRRSFAALLVSACAPVAPVAPLQPVPPARVEAVPDPDSPPPEAILARSRAILEQDAIAVLGAAAMNEVRAAREAIVVRRLGSLPRMIRQPDGSWKTEPAAVVAAVRTADGWVRLTRDGRQAFDPVASGQLDRALGGIMLWAEPIIASAGCTDPSGTIVLIRRAARERLSNLPCGLVGVTGEIAEIVLAGRITDWAKVPAELRPGGLVLGRFPGLEDYYLHSSGIAEPRLMDIRSPAEWEAQWFRLTARHGSAPPPPHVDFTREMVLLAAMGSRPSGGYAIRIESVLPRPEEYQVFVKETSPGPRCGAIAAVTSPADVVRVPATGKSVRWIVEKVVSDCP